MLALGEPGRVRKRVSARFVIDATGTRSLYARRMGARRRELDMLVSVTAFFELPERSDFARLTFLEAVEYGWWYTVRLPNRRIAVAVATEQATYKTRRFNQPRAWLQALARTSHIANLLDQCEPAANSLSPCTAPSFLLDRACGDHWLAVGDAASAYDPISSQGIFEAFADGLTGGQAIAAHLAGSSTALAEHQKSLVGRFDVYSRQRAYSYARAHRWRDVPFWVGRRSASGEAQPRASN